MKKLELSDYKLGSMITACVLVSIGLVALSLYIYSASGAEQLDLSRPGYKAVQSKVVDTGDLESFPSTGAMSTDVIDQFKKLYDEQEKRARATDAFSGDPLNPDNLGLTVPQCNASNGQTCDTTTGDSSPAD